jgi:PAS domain S-box-containing protein
MAGLTTPRWAQNITSEAMHFVGCVVAVVAVVSINSALRLPGELLRPAFCFLCLVLLAAAVWGIGWAVFLSFASTLGFGWMLPPTGGFKVNDWREAYAFTAFLIVACIGSYLSRRARTQAARAIQTEQELRDVMIAAPAFLWRTSRDGAVEFVNGRWHTFTGLPAEGAMGWNWQDTIHPDDQPRFAAEWKEALASGRAMEGEVRVRRADGQFRWWFVRNVPRKSESGDIVNWYGGGFDIEDRKLAEALLSRENQILEMVAQGESLPEILKALCLLVEGSADAALASILLVEGNRLRHGAAPSLPRQFAESVDGAQIGPSAGSCGTAAWRGEQVIVGDVATDPLWENYRELALRHSLRACWSTPVFSSRGAVIATFAMYYREPRTPDDTQQEMIRQIAHLAGIAIERKLTQDALRISESYLSEAQRVAHLGSWVWKVRSREAVYVSDEWYRIYEFDSAQGPPGLKERIERIHPDDRDRYVSAVEDAIAQESDYDVEYRILLPGERMKYIRVFGHPVRDEAGELVEFVGVAGDVTERRQTEMALRAAMDERIRLTAFREEIGLALSRQNGLKDMLHGCASAIVGHLNAAFARIWILSNNGRELELQASAGLYTNIDGSHSRIPVGHLKIGLIAQERKPHFTNDAQNDPHISERAWAQREDMRSFAGYPLLMEDRLVGVMGMFSKNPLKENTLDALSFAAGIIAQGIERKRAEEALRQSEEYLAEGQRLTHTGSWSVNVVTRQSLHSSDEHTRLFGFDPGKGTPPFEDFFRRVHPDDQKFMMETFQALAQSGGDLDLRYRIAVPGAPVRSMHAIGRPAPGRRGEYVGITIDVTDRMRLDEERDRLHQLEADLAHMNRVTTMGELTASLAHEVNQPITAAITSARTCIRWLARDTPNIERAREAAARIVDVTDRAAKIISRIRLLFRKGAPERQLVDVNEVVSDIIALLLNEANRYNISISTEFAHDLSPVMADRIQLQQVLMNLMINSIDAMKNTDDIRKLTFRSQREADDRVLISVSDTGIGLPPRADEVFNPFFTTKTEGTGMGLAISRSIVESHGGRLWATSNAGCGASFHFILPASADTQADQPPMSESRPA